MERDHIGIFLCIILAFFTCCVIPFVNIAVDTEMQDRRCIISDVDNFIDSVVDSRQITDGMIKELNTKLACYGILVDYEIIREQVEIEPDPLKPGDWYSSMIVAEDNRHYNQGDHVSVHIWTAGYNSSAAFSSSVCGVVLGTFDKTITARVR